MKEKEKGNFVKNTVSILLLLLALSFVALGMYRGEVSVVFNKAIRICMECVGLG